jgi:hypothetical protein
MRVRDGFGDGGEGGVVVAGGVGARLCLLGLLGGRIEDRDGCGGGEV